MAKDMQIFAWQCEGDPSIFFERYAHREESFNEYDRIDLVS